MPRFRGTLKHGRPCLSEQVRRNLAHSHPDALLRQAILDFFNEDFEASRSSIDSHIGLHPRDPLGYALLAATAFYRSTIRWIVSSDTLSVAALLRNPRPELPADPGEWLLGPLRRVEDLAPGERVSETALLARCIAEGVYRDYEGLVLRQWKASLAHAQEANLLGRKLLKANPRAHDAYCVFGFSESLLAHLPAAIRPLAAIPGVTGSPRKAIQYCEVAAKTGCYYREIARCMLIGLYSEENRAADALRILAELAAEFPRNALIAAELERRSQGNS